MSAKSNKEQAEVLEANAKEISACVESFETEHPRIAESVRLLSDSVARSHSLLFETLIDEYARSLTATQLRVRAIEMIICDKGITKKERIDDRVKKIAIHLRKTNEAQVRQVEALVAKKEAAKAKAKSKPAPIICMADTLKAGVKTVS